MALDGLRVRRHEEKRFWTKSSRSVFSYPTEDFVDSTCRAEATKDGDLGGTSALRILLCRDEAVAFARAWRSAHLFSRR